jgi:hypothetical protein
MNARHQQNLRSHQISGVPNYFSIIELAVLNVDWSHFMLFRLTWVRSKWRTIRCLFPVSAGYAASEVASANFCCGGTALPI